jgi:hypothetical protein
MRAAVQGSTGDAAVLDFVFHGPSHDAVPLANGELRRQIGLKLRAEDTCNVIYVMWELEPRSRIVVSVKRNPGQSTHAACGDRGYAALMPRVRGAPSSAPIAAGERHRLEAAIDGGALRVLADGQLVWEGELPANAIKLEGPIGIRSDNGVFDLELKAAKKGAPESGWPACER